MDIFLKHQNMQNFKMDANTEKKMTIRIFKAFLYLFILFVCHQRTICRNWFSCSTSWVPEIELGFRGKQLYLWSLLAGLCGFFFFAFVFCFVKDKGGETESVN